MRQVEVRPARGAHALEQRRGGGIFGMLGQQGNAGHGAGSSFGGCQAARVSGRRPGEGTLPAVAPASTGRITPVTQRASSLAR